MTMIKNPLPLLRDITATTTAFVLGGLAKGVFLAASILVVPLAIGLLVGPFFGQLPSYSWTREGSFGLIDFAMVVNVFIFAVAVLILLWEVAFRRTNLADRAGECAGAAAMWTAAMFLGFLVWGRANPQGWTYFGSVFLAWVVLVGLLRLSARYLTRGNGGDRVSVAAAEGEAIAASSGDKPSIPKIRFADIAGNEEIKSRIRAAVEEVLQKRMPNAKPRNGILLHGAPGNGKTVFAEAVAGELKVPLITLTQADVASQWVGEKTSRIREAFNRARAHQPCVLFLDEVDSFLETRSGGRDDGVKEDRDMVNALLTLLVDIRKSRVVVMAATNHMDKLDAAAVREGRFDFKIEITPPDAEARVGLLKRGLKANMPKAQVEDEVIAMVARRWNGFSVKRILAVTEELPGYMERQGTTGPVTFEDFMGALRTLQGGRGHRNEIVKPLEELVLSDMTRDMINLVANRMEDPEHTESHGGTLPTGVLFYGPPGTGKTAACKALAHKIQWAFLPTTGAEMARDPKSLERLFEKAKEMRPTIIFIDEADELLKSREFSSNTEATNKLLTLMDGVGDRVKDVVWIAATNHPEAIDPAMLRGGRFTEKVEFELPDATGIAAFLAAWLDKRKVKLDDGVSAMTMARLVDGQSIANVEAVAQTALNRAISRREQPVVVTLDDMTQAKRMVLGEG